MADIFVKRISCTKESVSEILDLFKLKNIIIEIDSIKKSDNLFKKIIQLDLRYTTSISEESSYFTIVLMSDIEKFKEILKYIFESDADSFAITSIDNVFQWEQYLYNRIPIRKLVKQGKFNINIVVAIHESTIDVSLNNEAYNAAQLVLNIKNLFNPTYCK